MNSCSKHSFQLLFGMHFESFRDFAFQIKEKIEIVNREMEKETVEGSEDN